MSQEHNKQADPTQERLLDEAERLFADKGYDGVSLREITAAAGTHLAAVNYHFGSKENLYLEVFRIRYMERARKIQQPLVDLEKQEHFTPEEVVRTLAKAFLSGPMTDEERQRHSQLVAREMGQQSKAFQLVSKEAMGPFMELAIRLWQRCLPQGMDQERLKLVVLSIFSQVLYFNFARPVVTLATGREYDEEFVDQIVEHITQFALCGLNGGNGK
ncbi:MAG: CerR family C-terminal domain-containing protein [Desulfarculus sp.]|nr:CerR family C-terminal domain-containing protein [Pseudomonadota bacterium]MBV1717370.1 CerR family C-terminal domain-containing protein [Desulfarculus sp.]MBU4576715.1 CerR family C-terminal domain-containing protein [Pseudomonadota bacterium]MBU4596193.1 CerR family C-terminal domain-containing protein [Pseudomonadota bacterium]MBV1739829.1 CerR family C-terminal domain-containing protein [Desulfarculus sp.]